MSSIKTTDRLLKRSVLTNLFMPRGIAITPLLVGTHGAGKTSICHQLATELNGECLVVEGGSLKEGEITGLPFGQKNEDGSSEVRFIPYYQTARIQQLEKAYYKKAQKQGFLDGTVKLNEDGTTSYKMNDQEYVIDPLDEEHTVIAGEDNKYKFGEALPADIKMKLLETGEIKPVVILIDEMNRTDNQTMKELMNIVLTRNVNGYDYPWWVFMVAAINPCGQDSIYSTNEMDPAQMDRFLKLKVSANFNEWSEWGIDNDIDDDYIIALSTATEAFTASGNGYEEKGNEDDVTPSPRSHTICSYIYKYANRISQTKFFNDEDRSESVTLSDIRELFIGKIGRYAGNLVFNALQNKKNYINPAEVLTGKDKVVKDAIIDKIMHMNSLARRILIKNISRYICTNLAEVYFKQNSKKPEEAKEAKATWQNILSQIKSLVAKLDAPTQLIFAKDSLDLKINLENSVYSKYNGKQNLFSLIGTTFSLDIIQQVSMTNAVSTNGSLDKK